ncbi:porin [Rhodocyclus tenuis]|uniref:Porin n=1 Tax=Rhodocyclus gracilis TaxID=2929842 RepID=A0ABX0WFJ6_9RHOO|nr:porin [Rhodocyclus gracilis]NJA88497.1 porin [Rhodocyclus gracilis]
MQKKLIALAVAGLVSGGAFAQSNVTVYGTLDATFESASATGAANTAGNLGPRSRISSNSSLLGFKGEEALGNGLSAVFQIETAITADGSSNTSVVKDANGATVGTTAGANTFGATRDTFVGLKSATLGTITAGLQTGPTRALGSAIDLNAGATGPGANSSLIGKINGINTGSSGTFDTRFANSIAYTSPSFAGFNAVAAYVAGENKTAENVSGAAKLNTSGYDLGGFYNNGPIYAGLTYGRLSTGTELTGKEFQSIARLAGAYTFEGGHKITALYEQNKVGYLGGAADLKQNIWGLGAKFMVTPAGGLIAQYYQAQDTSGAANNSNTGAKLYEVGYEYSLSKRTLVKASYNRIDNKDRANFDFNVGAVGNTSSYGAAAAGSNPQVIAVGLRHSF